MQLEKIALKAVPTIYFLSLSLWLRCQLCHPFELKLFLHLLTSSRLVSDPLFGRWNRVAGGDPPWVWRHSRSCPRPSRIWTRRFCSMRRSCSGDRPPTPASWRTSARSCRRPRPSTPPSRRSWTSSGTSWRRPTGRGMSTSRPQSHYPPAVTITSFQPSHLCPTPTSIPTASHTHPRTHWQTTNSLYAHTQPHRSPTHSHAHNHTQHSHTHKLTTVWK